MLSPWTVKMQNITSRTKLAVLDAYLISFNFAWFSYYFYHYPFQKFVVKVSDFSVMFTEAFILFYECFVHMSHILTWTLRHLRCVILVKKAQRGSILFEPETEIEFEFLYSYNNLTIYFLHFQNGGLYKKLIKSLKL